MKVLFVFGCQNSFSPTDQIAMKFLGSGMFSNVYAVCREKKGCFSSSTRNGNTFYLKYDINSSLKAVLKSKVSFFSKILFTFSKIMSFFSKKVLFHDRVLIYQYTKRIKQIIKEVEIDRVICFSGSFECSIATNKVCKKVNIPFETYFVDPYPFVNISKMNKAFKKILQNTKHLFVPIEYKQDYFSSFAKFADKIVPIEFPCLIEKERIKPLVNKNCVQKNVLISYFGSLGFDGRNIDHFINFVSVHPKLTLKLFSNYRLNKEVSNVKICPFVSEYEMINEMLKSNFLLIVDNDSKMLPSKCVRYVSTTKPIIILTNQTESSVVNFLKNYERKIIIYNNDLSNLYKQIELMNQIEYEFDDAQYEQYKRYLPNEVFAKVVKIINQTE